MMSIDFGASRQRSGRTTINVAATPGPLPAPSPEALALSRRLTTAIREEIAASGAMPFSRFMERCLYAPGLGYYSAGSAKFGAAGDFVTAPELGPLFARCVAHALAPALRACGDVAMWFELGGGSGAFARDALLELRALQATPSRYLLLEPSADLRERQRETLRAGLPPDLFARVEWLERPPQRAWSGVLFANEVLDALPATRFALAHGEVREEHVALNQAADPDTPFVRVDRPADALVAGAVRHVESQLGAFADGCRSEILPQLPWWLEAVTQGLQRGAMLFVDYGYPRREFYLPERRDGTLVCHYRHRAHVDPLWYPGLQDLTAFVDFTALAEAGDACGFEPVCYAAQTPFLAAAGLEAIFGEAYAAAADEPARMKLASEAKRLMLPGEMGERFQAMLFARELDARELFAPLIEIDRSERL